MVDQINADSLVEWKTANGKQALGRTQREKTENVKVAIVGVPECLGKSSMVNLALGSTLHSAVPIVSRPEKLSGTITCEDTIDETTPLSKMFSQWVDLAAEHMQDKGPSLSTDIKTYEVPWDNKTPEGSYLMSNTAFAEGATLPRGKCRRMFGNKPIKKTLFKGCTLKDVKLKNPASQEYEIEFGRSFSGERHASKT